LKKRLPKTNAQKKAEKLAADKAQGIKNLTLPLGPSDQLKLAALLERYQFEDWREMLTRIINVVHDGQGPDVLPVPTHTYEPSKKVLRQLYWLGKLEVDPDECE
jgi:hypothetical protein